MHLYVYRPPNMDPQAKALIERLGVEAQVSPLRSVPKLEALPAKANCVLVLSGAESHKLISRSLQRLAHLRKRWWGHLVLFSESPSPKVAVDWGRLLERFLPQQGHVCFEPAGAARVLKLRLRDVPRTPHGPDVLDLRSALGLIQEEMAKAAGVSLRTLQNWEGIRPSPQAERRLRDLIELRDTLRDYMSPGDMQAWLRSPNDSFGGPRPIDLIVDGRTRDVLLEFLSLRTGEPM
jgi:transcriptional regulator with XRE-family HTH domain